jgi:riboflavin kinase/FMN adenylyltransferase
MSVAFLNDFVPQHPSCVAIGVFDGVHVGHQAILKENCKTARSKNLKAVCLTFNPLPVQIMAPHLLGQNICSLSQRIELLLSSGFVDDVVIAPFTIEFSRFTPEQFVEQVLVRKISSKVITIGTDFRYGSGRQGAVSDLVNSGKLFDYSVNVIDDISDRSLRISSTAVRERINSGDIEGARQLLGHDFTLRGKIIRGKQLGRQIGFPTINLMPEETNQLLPKDGVYGGYAKIADSKKLIRAAISVGTNPTTDSDNARKVEAYLLDGFNSDWYDETVDLSFVKTIRDQIKYESIDQLIKQIDNDIETIKLTVPNLQ